MLKNAIATCSFLVLIACGPAGTTMPLRPGSPQVAAQIEMVALRVAIPETAHVKEDVFREVWAGRAMPPQVAKFVETFSSAQ